MAQGKEPTVVTKPMPTLIPAPKLNRNNSNEGSNEIKPLPKIVKKEKFWEYEEVDEKPKEKRKRKLVSINSAQWYIFNTNTKLVDQLKLF